MQRIPKSWQEVVGEETKKPYYKALTAFLEEERSRYTVYPPEDEVFQALELTPYNKVKVLLLGQDPYHDENQAHGLCFSVRPGIKPPRSLVNIFKEMRDDVGCPIPKSGYLASWAEQGVLMLNAVLTVRAHLANSHKDKGWERFTDQIIRRVNELDHTVVFLLWGGYAGKKSDLIDRDRHVVLRSAHPSPLSARHGFFGSRPFSKTNRALAEAGEKEIDWCIG